MKAGTVVPFVVAVRVMTPYDWGVYMDFVGRHGWRK